MLDFVPKPVTIEQYERVITGMGVSRRPTLEAINEALSSLILDETDWITFDPAHPVLDTASQGLSGRPFFLEGSNIVVRADVSAARRTRCIIRLRPASPHYRR